MIVYSPVPADPTALSAEHVALLDEFPARAKSLGAKVLGGSYFPKQRGFAFDPSTAAMTVQGGAVRAGTLVASDLVASAFFVLAAPSIDVATEVAMLHPAAVNGGVEVRPLYVPPGQKQDDYAD
ncbi:MAG: hypothetical protein CVT59_05645 [Actinobacteria bacterium HGW-Actinobacteria-1]|jgi:hypothetical protein|nr:MAG: hypothetical protein CVT59_05645 [Actinobacteria bacterium HGW-Actinobacteria-1]